MATVNATFQADIAKFARLVNDRVDTVLNGVAVALHGRVVDATPYRTGRARASWNITVGEPDGTPAPEFGGNTGFDASDADIAAANAFYDPIIDEKRRFDAPKGTTMISVANGLHYIEDLNAGRSQQAPAGFFQATVASVEALVNREIAKLSK